MLGRQLRSLRWKRTLTASTSWTRRPIGPAGPVGTVGDLGVGTVGDLGVGYRHSECQDLPGPSRRWIQWTWTLFASYP